MRPDERKILHSALPGALFVGLIWFIHFMAWVTGLNLAFLGVYPRHISGIPGIFLSPLIHGDLLHLLSNSFPVLLLSAFLFHHYRKLATEVCIWIYLTTNLWTFLLARQSYHIGASGLVYGLAGFLLFSGLFRRDRDSITLSAVVLVLYGGMVYGVLPLEDGISWESHLFGAISGLFLAWFFRKHYRKAKASTTTFRFEDLETLSDPYAPWNLTPPEVWLDRETWYKAQMEKEFLLQQQQQHITIPVTSGTEEPAEAINKAATHQNQSATSRVFTYKYVFVPQQNQKQNPDTTSQNSGDAKDLKY